MGSIIHGMRLISQSRTEVIAQAEYICSSNAYLGRGRNGPICPLSGSINVLNETRRLISHC
jgi:hypothetical protein